MTRLETTMKTTYRNAFLLLAGGGLMACQDPSVDKIQARVSDPIRTASASPSGATAYLNRKDFGIVYPGMPDDLIRDGVVIRLKVRGVRG
jgi:hypothetical protein